MPSEHRADLIDAVGAVTPSLHADMPFVHIYDAGNGTGPGIDVEEATERGKFRVFQLASNGEAEDDGIATVDEVYWRQAFEIVIGYAAGVQGDGEALFEVIGSDVRAVISYLRNPANLTATDVDKLEIGLAAATVEALPGPDDVAPGYLVRIPFTAWFYE